MIVLLFGLVSPPVAAQTDTDTRQRAEASTIPSRQYPGTNLEDYRVFSIFTGILSAQYVADGHLALHARERLAKALSATTDERIQELMERILEIDGTRATELSTSRQRTVCDADRASMSYPTLLAQLGQSRVNAEVIKRQAYQQFLALLTPEERNSFVSAMQALKSRIVLTAIEIEDFTRASIAEGDNASEEQMAAALRADIQKTCGPKPEASQ